MLAPSSLTFAALAATILAAVAPLARAELRQGPTGVEYAKRFQPSNGPGCYYICPFYDPQEPDVSGASKPPDTEAGTEFEGGASTSCTYTYTNNEVPAVTYTRTCAYDSFSGELLGGDDGCLGPAATSTGADSCAMVTRRRRSLTKLEQVIRARQYKPRRQAAGN